MSVGYPKFFMNFFHSFFFSALKSRLETNWNWTMMWIHIFPVLFIIQRGCHLEFDLDLQKTKKKRNEKNFVFFLLHRWRFFIFFSFFLLRFASLLLHLSSLISFSSSDLSWRYTRSCSLTSYNRWAWYFSLSQFSINRADLVFKQLSMSKSGRTKEMKRNPLMWETEWYEPFLSFQSPKRETNKSVS